MTAPRQVRHFLDIKDHDAATLRAILDHAREVKERRQGLPRGAQDREPLLPGRALAMVFEQVSTRTRISFDVGMRQMGGETLYLTGHELQLGRGESIADTARVLSRYVDAIMIRILDHAMLTDLAAYADIPVINGLTKKSHPCQIMADVLTFEERKGPIAGKTVAWVGDTNNVTASWIEAAVVLGFEMRVAAPADHSVGHATREWVRAHDGTVYFTESPVEAVRAADCVVTDTWVSLGDEEADERYQRLAPYQVTQDLMAQAKPDAVFMHCLPAHRGEEMTAGVIDGPQSAVWDEAENRLHAQKSVLAWCLDAI